MGIMWSSPQGLNHILRPGALRTGAEVHVILNVDEIGSNVDRLLPNNVMVPCKCT